MNMIKSVNSFYKIIDSNEEEVKEILQNINQFYYEYYKLKSDRVSRRYFNPSIKKLKDIQNKIQTRILQKVKLVPNVLGGVKGFGNVDNAFVHSQNSFFFQTDLTGFFPSVSRNMVVNALIPKGFSIKVAELITSLCVLSTKDGHRIETLPQGAPTSPMLANIVFEKVDKEILVLIENVNITYTRWIDDLTFSSKTDFSEKNIEILKIIASRGFKVSRRKTTYKRESTIITGVLLKKKKLYVTKNFDSIDESRLNPKQLKGRQNYRNQVSRRN